MPKPFDWQDSEDLVQRTSPPARRLRVLKGDAEPPDTTPLRFPRPQTHERLDPSITVRELAKRFASTDSR